MPYSRFDIPYPFAKTNEPFRITPTAKPGEFVLFQRANSRSMPAISESDSFGWGAALLANARTLLKIETNRNIEQREASDMLFIRRRAALKVRSSPATTIAAHCGSENRRSGSGPRYRLQACLLAFDLRTLGIANQPPPTCCDACPDSLNNSEWPSPLQKPVYGTHQTRSRKSEYEPWAALFQRICKKHRTDCNQTKRSERFHRPECERVGQQFPQSAISLARLLQPPRRPARPSLDPDTRTPSDAKAG